jgi:hypothetical protein
MIRLIKHLLFGCSWIDTKMKYVEELHGHRIEQECWCSKKRLYTPTDKVD